MRKLKRTRKRIRTIAALPKGFPVEEPGQDIDEYNKVVAAEVPTIKVPADYSRRAADLIAREAADRVRREWGLPPRLGAIARGYVPPRDGEERCTALGYHNYGPLMTEGGAPFHAPRRWCLHCGVKEMPLSQMSVGDLRERANTYALASSSSLKSMSKGRVLRIIESYLETGDNKYDGDAEDY